MISFKVVATVAALSVLIGIGLRNGNRRKEITIATEINDVYDYVIIGGGTAGSVLAGRLAEDSDVTVLILESGGDFQDHPDFYKPSKWPTLLEGQHDWSFKTESQTNSFHGMKDKQSIWPRGHVLGGSGSINLLQYARGSSFDFDEWESAGCTGWGYEDVLPYFLKSEDAMSNGLKKSKYHNTGGKIAAVEVDPSPLAERFIDAAQKLGFDVGDYNGKRQNVVGKLQINTRNGVRSSAAIEYLKDNGENLDISVDSHVTKINIVDNTAVGVYFVKNNQKRYVRAKKEVIVSAGTVNSPQILMLSGIGPKKHLQEMDIHVVSDIPVGENLQDHQQTPVCIRINEPLSVTENRRNGLLSSIQYQLFGTGYQTIAGTDASLFFHLDESKKETSYPDIQMVFYPALIDGLNVNYADHVAKEVFSDPDENGFCVFVALTHPRARGTIQLRSSDPFDPPVINPQYFSDPRDVQDIAKALKVWTRLVESESFADVGIDMNFLKKSFCAQFEFQSNDYWECFVRHISITQFHPTSSCKMGPLSDSATVVGPDLKVKGVDNLRVVDASIFPNVTSGNTNTPTVMVAEKAADLIKGKII